MNRFFQRFCYIFVANTTLLMTTAAYAETEAVDFRVDRSDASLQVLEQIFGLVDGVLYGTGTQVVGKMFGVFNASVLALGGIFLTYTMLVSTINTAQDGEVMGKQWSSVWIPMRVTFGVGLLVPKASGYCMMQVFVMWIVVQGIGAANQIWGSALTYLKDGGVLYSKPNASVIENAENIEGASKMQIAAQLLDTLVCMNAVEASLNNWQDELDRVGVSYDSKVPDFYSTLNVSKLRDDKEESMLVPNFQEGPYNAINGVCGTINIAAFTLGDMRNKMTSAGKERKGTHLFGEGVSKGVNITTREKGVSSEYAVRMEERAESAIRLASQQILDELNNTAQLIVERNNKQVMDYKKSISVDDENLEDINAEMDDSTTNPVVEFDSVTKFGSCFPSEANCAEWKDADNPTLMTGYELQTAILSYYAIVMPFLNSINRDKDSIKFIPTAEKQGWITAGSYFFDMTRLTQKLGELNPNEFFRISVSSPANKQKYGEDGNSENFQEKFNALSNRLDLSYPDEVTPESVDLYKKFILMQLDDPDPNYASRTTGGVLALWRVSSEDSRYYDESFTKTLADLQNRQGPTNFFKKPNYKSYFKISGLIRMPDLIGFKSGGCSFWKFTSCFHKSITQTIFKVLAAIVQLIFEIVISILTMLEAVINQTLGRLIGAGIEDLFNQAVNPEGHPIVNLATAGENMMEYAWDGILTIMGIMMFLALTHKGAADMFWKTIGKKIASIFLVFLMIFGYSFAFYAPLLPWIIFLFAALGWVLAVIEAMVAAPIVALGLTHPEGQNQVFGKAEQAIMIIINVFLRPSLMIIGYIIGIVLSYVFIQFAAIGFSKVNDSIMGVSSVRNQDGLGSSFVNSAADGIATAVGGSAQNEGKKGITGLLGPIYMLCIFMFVYVEIVKKCFSLTYLLPDQILRWLSGGVAEQFGSQTAGQMEQAVNQQAQKAEQTALPSPKMLDAFDKKEQARNNNNNQNNNSGGGGGGGDS